jgi:hypothetical protein
MMISRVDESRLELQLTKDTAISYRLVMSRNNKSKRSVVKQGCLPLDLVSLWTSPLFVSRQPLRWIVRLSVPSPLSSFLYTLFSSLLILKKMVKPEHCARRVSGRISSFHRDFPYDPLRWRDNLVLESREGVQFHFALQILIDASAFFAGAPVSTPSDDEEPVPGHGRLQPITLTFASSPALRYLLIVLRQTSGIRNVKPLRLSSMGNARQEPPWEITIESVRVAEILDAPGLAKAILDRSRLDAYHRRLILDALDIPNTGRVDLSKPGRNGDASDLSFSLEAGIHYRRCFNVLKELNPRALDGLTRVHLRRIIAMTDLEEAWQNPATRLLKKVCSTESRRVHDVTCNTRMLSTRTVRHQMKSLTPIMMDVLAVAKSKHQRTSKIRAMLSPRFNGCRGCLDDLSGVYMPALRRFQEDFPASPDEL